MEVVGFLGSGQNLKWQNHEYISIHKLFFMRIERYSTNLIFVNLNKKEHDLKFKRVTI